MTGEIYKDEAKLDEGLKTLGKAKKELIDVSTRIQEQKQIIIGARNSNIGAEYFGGVNSAIEEILNETKKINNQIRGVSYDFDVYAGGVPETTTETDLAFFGTLAMGGTKILEGFTKGLENMFDGAVSLVGGVASWIGLKSFGNVCADIVKFDTGSLFQGLYQTKLYQSSAIKEDGTFAKILRGAGYIGSYVVVGSVAGGTTAANMATAFAEGMGRTTEDALNAGYEMGEASAKGLWSGTKQAIFAGSMDMLFRYGPRGAVKKIKTDLGNLKTNVVDWKSKSIFASADDIANNVTKISGQVDDISINAKNMVAEAQKARNALRTRANAPDATEAIKKAASEADELLKRAQALSKTSTTNAADLAQKATDLAQKVASGSTDDITLKTLNEVTKLKNGLQKELAQVTKLTAQTTDDVAQIALKEAKQTYDAVKEMYDLATADPKMASVVPEWKKLLTTAKGQLTSASKAAEAAAKNVPTAVVNAIPATGFSRAKYILSDPKNLARVTGTAVVKDWGYLSGSTDIGDKVGGLFGDSDNTGNYEIPSELPSTEQDTGGGGSSYYGGGGGGYSGGGGGGYSGGGGGSFPGATTLTDTSNTPDTSIKPSELATSVNQQIPGPSTSTGGSAGGRGYFDPSKEIVNAEVKPNIPNHFDDFKEIDLEKLYGSEPDPILMEPDIMEPYANIDTIPDVMEPEIIMPDAVQPDIITIPDDVPVEKTTDAGKILGVAAGTMAAAGAGIGAYSYVKNKKDEDFDEDGYVYEYEEESGDDSGADVDFNTIDSVENI